MSVHLEFPFSRNEFLESTFEKCPTLIEHCFDASAFDWKIIDDALNFQDSRRTFLKVLKNGRIETEDYVEEFMDVGISRHRILKEKLYRHLIEGATIVLNRIELISPAMLDLCIQVGRLIGTQTSGNAYACLGGEPATNVHWDTHDVFILQLTGMKDWKIYEPTFHLPLSNQISNDQKNTVPQLPYLQHRLQAGQVLYIPRGWWHRVSPVAGNDTIHLTVAIHTPLILDYLIWSCGNVLPNFLSLRHSMLGRSVEKELLQEAMKTITQVLADSSTINAFHERARQRERCITPFQINCLLKKNFHFNDSDYVRINTRSAHCSESLYLINGKFAQVDGSLLAILQLLSTRTEMTIRELAEDIPHLAGAELDRLLRSLMQLDFIEIINRK